jgi:hypothetical protein
VLIKNTAAQASKNAATPATIIFIIEFSQNVKLNAVNIKAKQIKQK